jgi:hypothetical protein
MALDDSRRDAPESRTFITDGDGAAGRRPRETR